MTLDYYKEPTTITEVFSQLDSRLEELQRNHQIVNIYDPVLDDFSILKIERNIRRFPNDALARLDSSILEVTRLQKLGSRIMKHVYVDTVSLLPHQINVRPGSKVEKKKLMYSVLKKELNYYFEKLSLLKIEMIKYLSQQNVYVGGVNLDQLRPKKVKDQRVDFDGVQLSFLFDYLRMLHVIQHFDDVALSKIIHALTGLSDDQILKKGLYELKNYRVNIKSRPKGLKSMEKIKDLCLNMIELIEREKNALKRKTV